MTTGNGTRAGPSGLAQRFKNLARRWGQCGRVLVDQLGQDWRLAVLLTALAASLVGALMVPSVQAGAVTLYAIVAAAEVLRRMGGGGKEPKQ